MVIKHTSFSAIGAITLLTHASICLAGHDRHLHRPRQATCNPGVSAGQLSLLESEMTTFRGWIEAWFDSTATADPGAAVAQLKEEFEAYDSWMSAWLNSTIGSAPAPAPIFTSVPLPPSQHPSLAPSPAISSVSPVIVTLLTTSVLQPIVTSPTASASSGLVSPYSETVSESRPLSGSSQATPSSIIVLPHSVISTPIGTSSIVQPPISIATTLSTDTSGTFDFPSVISVSSVSPATSAPSNPISSGGTFDAGSNSNVAVYYGQTAATSQVTLAQMCQDPNVNIIILAFLTEIAGPGNYPTVNFGAACGGSSPAQTAAGATGLLNCPAMATDIITCQGLGKKVMLSIGGASATSAFTSVAQAQSFATQVWNLFGSGTGEASDLRPFGSTILDGVDIDNEDHSTAYWSDFVTALRSAMNSDKSKIYYISAAPQCPRPDASIPLDAMQTMDFVWVQFYNNGDCNVGASDFISSLTAWSSDLSATGKGPMLYIGAPGCTACAGSGYLSPAAMAAAIDSAKAANLKNLGGVMLWDGPEALQNTAGGNDYTEVVKSALT
ncbi:hypothetical protein JMJ35_008711 [Cladonia borealis]|uniref:chitinase n=1 Tax=Cladonia borealis TaxID=184061 RepID=A0AA39V722_9LECA|nr:hypothetical protein JMJ35_008711 [Cladonia borealis]